MRGTQEDLIAFVSQLKGHKILIRGNHDDIISGRAIKVYLYTHHVIIYMKNLSF